MEPIHFIAFNTCLFCSIRVFFKHIFHSRKWTLHWDPVYKKRMYTYVCVLEPNIQWNWMDFTTREVLIFSLLILCEKECALVFLSISSASTSPGTQWHARNAAKQHFGNTGYQTGNTWKANNIRMVTSWGDMRRCPVTRISSLFWRTERNMCIGFDLLRVVLAIS